MLKVFSTFNIVLWLYVDKLTVLKVKFFWNKINMSTIIRPDFESHIWQHKHLFILNTKLVIFYQVTLERKSQSESLIWKKKFIEERNSNQNIFFFFLNTTLWLLLDIWMKIFQTSETPSTDDKSAVNRSAFQLLYDFPSLSLLLFHALLIRTALLTETKCR